MRSRAGGVLLGLLLLLVLVVVGSAKADGLEGAIGARLGAATVEAPSSAASRWEVGPVAAVSPTVTGTGAAVSYRLSEAAQRLAVWATGGVLRWEAQTDAFVGLDTNVPIGGQTLQENGRVGGGWLVRGRQPFVYTRAAWKF